MQNTKKMPGEHASVIYGTHYPHRLFVGCLPPEAGAEDLGSFFATYGNVVEAKIVLDHVGNSKRFGFVTFSKPEEVESLIACGDIHFKGKKINVGPAVKKNVRGTTNEVQEISAKIPTTNSVPTTSTREVKPPAPLNIPSIPTTQHTPKTVIRRSPSDCTKKGSCPEDNSFQNIWGISTQPSSIWSPLNSQSYGLPNPAVRPSVNTTSNRNRNTRFQNSLTNLTCTTDELNYNRRHANNNFNNLPIGSIYKNPNHYQNCPTNSINTSRVNAPPGFSPNSVMFDNCF